MILRLIIVLVITASFTVLQGMMSHRWADPPELQASERLVELIPKTIASWEYDDEANELSEPIVRELGITRYISREYTKDRADISLMYMTGWAKRLIRHTPDICFATRGNSFITGPKPFSFEVDGKKHELLQLPVRPDSGMSDDFLVIYGFMQDGQFSATTRPRLEYHGTSVVQKIQMICDPGPDSKNPEIPDDAMQFLEELTRYLTSDL